MSDKSERVVGGAGCATSGLLGGLGVVLLVVAMVLVAFAVSCFGAGAEWGATDHSIGLGAILGPALDLVIALVGIVGVGLAVLGIGAVGVAAAAGVLGASVLNRFGLDRRPPRTDDQEGR